MKVEIKLDKEQFDALLAALNKIARGDKVELTYRTDPVNDVVETVTDTQPYGGGKTKHEGFVSLKTIYNNVGGGVSGDFILSCCEMLKVTPKKFVDSSTYSIPVRYREAVTDLARKAKEKRAEKA